MSIKSNCIPNVANGANTNAALAPSLSELLSLRRNQFLSNTIDRVTTGAIAGNGGTLDLGKVYSNGYRLAYLNNRANTLTSCSIINDAGSLVTTAYEGNAVVPSNNPNNLSR